MWSWMLATALAQQPTEVPEPAPVPEAEPAPGIELVPAPAPLPGPRQRELHLLVSGATGGIGSGQWRFEVVERLEDADHPVVSMPRHGVLARGEELLVAADGRVETLVTLLAGGARCDAPEPGWSSTLDTERVVGVGEAPTFARAFEARVTEVAVRRCHGDGGDALWLAPEGELGQRLGDWEFRLGLELTWKDGQAWSVGLPQRDAARRVALLESLSGENTLFVDAGGFVDGSSAVRDAGLSLHRSTALSALQRLGPAALVPGDSELAGGAARLLGEAGEHGLSYVATNWKTEDGGLALPDALLSEVEGVTIAWYGVVDVEPATRSLLASEGVTVTDPVDAVREAIAEVDADLHIVLTTSAPGVRASLQELAGVDLVLGDATSPATREQVVLRTLDQRGAAPALALGDAGEVRLRIEEEPGGWRVIEVEQEAHHALPEQAPDPAVRAAVTSVRAEEYPRYDAPLLDREVDEHEWNKVVCEAVRSATDADLVVLDELAVNSPVPGPLTELMVIDRLAVMDTLEVHRVPGDRLMRLMLRLYGVVGNTCGADLTDKYAMTRGRYIEAERLYRVVTTDRTRERLGIDGDFSEAHSPWFLDQVDAVDVPSEAGKPLTLRRVVLQELRAQRDAAENEGEVVDPLVSRDQTEKPPMWLLRVNTLAVSVEGFQGADDDRYDEFPETLATSPSSFALGAELDLALDYSSVGIIWDARVRSEYTRLSTEGTTQETADDLRLSSSGTLPLLSVPTGWVTWRPYGELLYDSEFTPAEDSSTPLQQDLSVTAGISAARKGWLRTLRIGALVLKDLAVLDKAPEFGGRLEGETKTVFGPNLKWVNTVDAYVFANSPGQDASDLRFKVLLDSTISLPLARWLAIELYGQGFLFSGRVATTERLGFSYTLGAQLDVSGAFEL